MPGENLPRQRVACTVESAPGCSDARIDSAIERRESYLLSAGYVRHGPYNPIAPMEHNEIVETSDPEEAEALAAIAPGYWGPTSNLLRISGKLDKRVSIIEERDFVSGLRRASGVARVGHSPWKRMKVSHSAESRVASSPVTPVKTSRDSNGTSEQSSTLIGFKDALQLSAVRSSMNTRLRASGHSVSPTRVVEIHKKPLQLAHNDTNNGISHSSPPRSMSLSPDPLALLAPPEANSSNEKGNPPDPRVVMLRDMQSSLSTQLRSNGDLQGDIPKPSPYVTGTGAIHDDALIHSSLSSPGRSRSLSPDPLALFTPPRIENKAPTTESSLEARISDALPRVSAASRQRHSPSDPAASLEQIISDSDRMLFPSPPPILPSPLMSHPRSPNSSHALHRVTASMSNADDSIIARALAQEEEHARGRYALRVRQARQKNPYAYDKALYKQQMRANPEAIIRVVSPSRRKHRRTSSRGDEELDVRSSDGWEDESLETQQEQDVDVEERRDARSGKGKERSASASAAPGEEDQRRRGWMSRSVSIRGQDPTSSRAQAQSHSRAHPSGEVWYPEDFNVDFSSSSEDEAECAEFNATAGKDKEEHQQSKKNALKRRPFPMRKRRLARRPPGMQESRESPSSPPPQSLVSFAMDEANDLQSDDDHPLLYQQWRRRQSSSPIVRSPPKSRSPSSAPFPPPDADIPSDDYDHNLFLFKSESPGPPPLSSTPTDVDAMLSEVGIPDDPGSDPDSDVEMNSDLRSRRSRTTDSESNSEMERLNAKDRKRMKVLQRMMPRVLIKRLEEASTVRPQLSYNDSDSDVQREDRPLRPGQTRVRMTDSSRRRSVEVRGDSESSGAPATVDSPLKTSSSSESEMDMVVAPSRKRIALASQHYHHNRMAAASETDAEERSNDGDSIDDAEVGRWVSEKAARGRKPGVLDELEAREGDLIDRMLSRTRVTSGKVRRLRRLPGSRHTRKAKSSVQNNLHVVTAGARKAGSGRQTLLPFSRVAVPSTGENSHPADTTDLEEQDVPMDQSSAQLPVIKRKRNKRKKTAGLFVFTAGRGSLTSGRLHKQPITIDEEVSLPNTNVNLHSAANHQITTRPVEATRRRHDGGRHRTDRLVDITLDELWQLHGEEEDSLSRDHAHEKVNLRRVSLDFDIPVLASGLSFGPDSYLGKGHLHQLITLLEGHNVLRPGPCTLLGMHLDPDMSIYDLIALLQEICDRTHILLSQGRDLSAEDHQHWQNLLHSACQHLSWLLNNASDAEFVSLDAAAEKHISQIWTFVEEPTEIIPEDETPRALIPELCWFAIEAAARLKHQRIRRHSQASDASFSHHLFRFLCCLFNLGIDNLFDGLAEPSENNLLPRRISELWVCIMHLVEAWNPSIHCSGKDEPISCASFWEVYLRALQSKHLIQSTSVDLATCEQIWRSIFALSSLSQFSRHGITTSTPRLGASWELVLAAMERIPFTVQPGLEDNLPRRSVQKRDEYIRLLVSRCLVLSSRWRWSLEDANALFTRLLEIFRSRKFANLSDEPSDFPSFLRHSNLQILSECKRSDTAYTLFLKMVIQAAKDTHPGPGYTQSSVASPKIKKLLSLCVPVGSVPFTKATPPTASDLSKLYNRFSAVAVAIYLEPIEINLKNRIANARRYVNFEDTDDETRRACIRGLMHLTILMRHLSLPLEDLLDWLADMTNILIDEHREAERAGHPRNRVDLNIQLLLGCVRRIIETPMMDPGQRMAQYPNPALLNGPWVSRIFAAANKLTLVPTTRVEIRKLVQAFLDARAAVIPKPSRHRLAAAPTEESQESQDDYGLFDLDMDDPELLAALGEADKSHTLQENKRKDEIVCEIIDAHVSPAIYRLICQYFNESADQGSLQQYSQDADKWVDCWVGCASVIVQNGKRDWSLYLTLGPQSWERIINTAWRRRVGLRFMLMLLRLDPSAYDAFTDRFINILLESMVAVTVTLEHEYTSLLFSIDGLHHSLLRGMPCERHPGSAELSISRKEFLDRRLAFIDTISSNMEHLLLRNVGFDAALIRENQSGITAIVSMLSTMQDIHQQLTAGSDDMLRYTSFCRQIYDHLIRYPNLKANTRLQSLSDWASGLN
ncbi:hypothetical protein WOLCODRAFT_142800 [Wolfiporia cocos MD-104 SS10]|uniref:Mus7/MMS22 family-domain-containing protein n=1 Tax=Wolfiporia cocos (strain MD-104) TaxID=742152 RepID=A0A2H3JE66_WOLCO|nr:hypothetical protein WOLCODRAFT_142800 [Wolfiporia cocos MD-104 SS10]